MTVDAADARPTTAQAPTVKQLRHRAEVPMLVLGGTLSLGGIVVLLVLLGTGTEAPGWLTPAVAAVFAGPVIASVVVIRYKFWSTVSNAVEVTPDQFPEIHAIFRELAERMGMTPEESGMNELPRLYVINGNGLINAYAAKCQIDRAYVMIYSDFVDVAYELDDFSTVRFALAHELGHIRCRHVSLWRIMLQPVARLIFLSDSITRAQEYTADRVASYYAPEGAEGLLVLFAGKRMYRRVDLDAYFDSVERHPDGLWLKVANFRSNHAVGFRRMEALRRIRTEGWDVHGRML